MNELQINTPNDILFNEPAMRQIFSLAKVMSMATITVPKHLQGKEGDCLAIIIQASQWRMNPYLVAQKTHLVNGTLGYEAQLVNAIITASTAIDGHFHYEYSPEFASDSDPKAWVRVGAKIKGDTEITWGEKLYPSKVQVKNSPLWKTNPKQQAAYLALKYWARLYKPEIIMGIYTPDEILDHQRPEEKIINPLPEDNEEILTLDSILSTVAANTNGDFSYLDAKKMKQAGFTPEDISTVKQAVLKRRAELAEMSVVSTHDTTPDVTETLKPETEHAE